MIRRIVEPNDEPCTEVDVTFENGLAHSVLRPIDGLIWDLVHTIKEVKTMERNLNLLKKSLGVETENRVFIECVTAKHIGYNKKALVFAHKARVTVLLNPVIESRSGGNGLYHKKITISYYTTDGCHYTAKFSGDQSRTMQDALKIIGVGKIKT